jgi:hypothetical protein
MPGSTAGELDPLFFLLTSVNAFANALGNPEAGDWDIAGDAVNSVVSGLGIVSLANSLEWAVGAAGGALGAGASGADAASGAVASEQATAAEGGDTVQTFSSGLAPATAGEGISLEQAAAAASRNGIDMRVFQLEYEAGAKATDYAFTSQNGAGDILRAENGRFILTLTDPGLTSEEDAVNSIAHELNHVREILGGPPGTFIEDESSATNAGYLAQRYFR